MTRFRQAPSAASTQAQARRESTSAPRRAKLLLCLAAAVFIAPIADGVPTVQAQEACPNEARRIEQNSTSLSDCRAYEQVSPTNKNGGDVLLDSATARAAESESASLPMATTFDSLTGFGDVVGTGVQTEYMSIRESAGWLTHGITPPQDPLTFSADFQSLMDLYDGEFSADLSHGIFRAWSPLTEDPNVAHVENLYLRDNLRSPGPGSYQLLTACPLCESTSTPLPTMTSTFQRPALAGTSADLSRAVFESSEKLTPEATADPNEPILNVYESNGGTVRLVGLVPPSGEDACVDPECVPALSSAAGQGALQGYYTLHVMSADGSRITFTDNSETFSNTGNLYERVDNAETIKLNVIEGGSGSGPTEATYWNASADGTRVFFTTAQQLTSDDGNSSPDVYMYDATTAPGEHLTRLSVDHNPSDGEGEPVGVIGVSDDGSYVYFIASNQLVAEAPTMSGNLGLFAWHNGSLAYIGQLANPSDLTIDLPQAWGLIPLAARVTSDGSHLLFSSRADPLTGEENGSCGGGCSELYVYDFDLPEIGAVCASCPESGEAAAHAQDNVRTTTGGSGTTSHLNHPIAADGRFVFFSTADPVLPEDTNGAVDAYVYDTSTGKAHLLSSGVDPADSYFMDASADGKDVFFITRQRLVGWDNDQNYDLYDARIGGGFTEPAALPPPCEADDCRMFSQPPVASATGTPNFVGPGNPVPHHRCPKGKRRVKTRGGKIRCIKRKHKVRPKRNANQRRAAR